MIKNDCYKHVVRFSKFLPVTFQQISNKCKQEACYNAVGASTSLEGLAQITGLNYGNTTQCHDIMQEYVHCSDPTGCGLGKDAVAWDYQVLHEFYLVLNIILHTYGKQVIVYGDNLRFMFTLSKVMFLSFF